VAGWGVRRGGGGGGRGGATPDGGECDRIKRGWGRENFGRQNRTRAQVDPIVQRHYGWTESAELIRREGTRDVERGLLRPSPQKSLCA
jgi:hypothetical protein